MYDDPDKFAEIAEPHHNFVVPIDKASNNIVFVCKSFCINCLMKELGMSTIIEDPTYKLTTLSRVEEEILQTPNSVFVSFKTSFSYEDLDLPKFYWIHTNNVTL